MADEAREQLSRFEREYVNYADLKRILQRNATLILSAALIGFALAATYTMTAKAIFTARTQLLIDPGISQLPRNVGDTVTVMDTSQVETQMAVLRSERIIEAVVDRLKLNGDPEFVGSGSRWSWLGSGQTKADSDFERSRRGMAAIQSRLEVRRVGLSYAIDILFNSRDPDKAARIANEIADSFVRDHVASRAVSARQSSEWLEARLTGLRQKMNSSALAVQEFKARRDYRIVAKSNPSASDDAGTAGSAQLSKTELNTLEELESTAATYRKIYETYLQAYTETMHRQSFTVSIARVITAATRPLQKSHPRTGLILAFGSLAGVLSGLALAFLRHNLDGSVRSPAQIREELGLQCLGRVPAINPAPATGGQARLYSAATRLLGISPSHKKGSSANTFTIVRDAPFSVFSENLRAIKTNIGLVNRKDPVRCIGVTSALASEGKSTIASNLAILYALSGARVLLVDADARNSAVSRFFAPDANCGLLQAISGEQKLEECVTSVANVPPGHGRIDVLPFAKAGERDAKGVELPGTGKMSDLIQHMLSTYDAIVFDLPPAKMVSDALVISGLLQGVLLAAAENETPLPLLAEVAHDLTSAGAKVIGVALTKADVTAAGAYTYGMYPRVSLARRMV